MSVWDKQYEEKHGLRYWPDENLVRYLASIGKASTLPHALELGCGNGRNGRAIMHAGYEYYGVDGSLAAIDLARDENFGGHYSHAQIPPLNYGDASFDLVVDIQCLQHMTINKHAAILSEIRRVLNPGGRFYSMHLSHISTDCHIMGLRGQWMDEMTVEKAFGDNIIFPNEAPTCYISFAMIEQLYRDAGLIILQNNALSRTYEERRFRTDSLTPAAFWYLTEAQKPRSEE